MSVGLLRPSEVYIHVGGQGAVHEYKCLWLGVWGSFGFLLVLILNSLESIGLFFVFVYCYFETGSPIGSLGWP